MKKNKLNELLLSNSKLLFIGVGNALLSDDRTGIYICENIQQRRNIQTLIVESSIEKFVGKINSIDHDVLILTDCTDFGEKAGFWDIVEVKDIMDATINTHTISLKRVSEFFNEKVFLLGVQPENTKFGEEFSDKVQKAATEILKLVNTY
jgi:hydrogenase maturation protease